MAHLLWGNIYYKDHFAGTLRQEPGDRTSFTYHDSYLSSGQPSIAHTLPLQAAPFLSESGLPPFFDNLVAEGWLEEAQTRLLAKRRASWQPNAPRYTTGVLGKYARLVQGAETGAITNTLP